LLPLSSVIKPEKNISIHIFFYVFVQSVSRHERGT